MQVHVQLAADGRVFVALFVQLASCLAVRFPHQIVLALPAETESLGGPRIVAIPRLCGAVDG